MNATQFALCEARDDRFPFNIRPMDENMFSTGTDDAL
jgi:hypothetical protein